MKKLFGIVLILLFKFNSQAQVPEFQTEYDSAAINAFLDSMAVFYDSVEATIKYQSGEIEIANGAAIINVAAGYKFISAEQSQYIMSELYGNPDDRSIAGILMPEELGVTYGEGFMFVLYYREIGYVDDKDADAIDADQLMDLILEDALEDNRNRVAGRLETYKVIGWARRPSYDKSKHELSWAKELKFDSDMETNTLNYNIVLLGRYGVISMNAIATMNELKQVETARESIRNMITFNKDFNYTDHDPKTDSVSIWTLNGLITGTTSVEIDAPEKNKTNLYLGVIITGIIFLIVRYFLRRKKNNAV